ncbi:MAG TPA: hypothetical protein VF141_19545, partial [Chryseolinea sp.]
MHITAQDDGLLNDKPYISFRRIKRYQHRTISKSPSEMNKLLILILSLVSSTLAVAQTFNRDQIVGTWTAKEVSFTAPIGRTPQEKSTAEKTKRGL